ncbi:quinone-dependent dihydroorotate dehydrogenase [Aliihoeflea sp. PC F10.4]
MKMLYHALARPFLFGLDAERAHGLSIAGLKSGVPVCAPPAADARLRTEIAGLSFPNPLGMAAGYDKNGEAPDALLKLGLGFAEIGTVTPKPQAGNPKPRIFRLIEDEAIVNRLGFNNEGHDACVRRMRERSGRSGIVGVNIGANKDSTDRIADYAAGVERFADLTSYLTVNISSPNTPGLRDLQTRASLQELLDAVVSARGERVVPVFLKIAPDLADGDLEDIAETVLARKIEGIIVSNTTLSRSGLQSALATEAGGVSGRPLFHRSTVMLARMRRLVGPALPLIGVGGVSSAETALEKIRAGADLVQLYTGMVYGGPTLPGEIVRGMSAFVTKEGLSSIRDIRDSRTDHWAVQTLD